MRVKIVDERFDKKLQDVIKKNYQEVFDKLDSILPLGPDSEVTVTLTNIGDGSVMAKMSSPNFTVVREFAPYKGSFKLKNHLLELPPALQKQGIADLFNRAGVKTLEELGGKIIELDANIDVGGYAWLRKGFWPSGGKKDLDYIIGARLRNGKIPEELATKWMSLSEDEAKSFVLSDKMKEFKQAFLGSNWEGSADISDPKIRALVTGEKLAQEAKVAGTINEMYRDAALRHQIGVRRYSSGVAMKVSNLLEKADADLTEKLRKRLLQFNGKPVDVTSERWTSLLGDIRALRSETIKTLSNTVTPELIDLGQHEAEGELATLNSIVPLEVEFAAVSAAQLRAIATETPFNGHLLKDWFDTLEQSDQKALVQTLQIGMVQGEPVDDIVRRIVGTRANKYTDGVLSITRRNAQAVVRTAINHVSNTARNYIWEENPTIIGAKIWSATLDGRTSAICRARDGHGTPNGKGELPTGIAPLDPPTVRPPAHVNCRSTMVAYIDGTGLVGNRPFVTDVRTRKKREIDFKKMAKEQGRPIQEIRAEWAAKNVGQVPASTTYQEFLSRQSKEFQDNVLGPTKARIFREGKLKLDQFVDRSGNELSLTQLKELHPQLRMGTEKSNVQQFDKFEKEKAYTKEIISRVNDEPFKHLSGKIREHIYEYTQDGYQEVNEALRNGRTNLPMIQSLDKAITHPKVDRFTQPGMVYRGLQLKQEQIDNIVEGAILKDSGFMSTSGEESVAHRFATKNLLMDHKPVVLNILVRTGTGYLNLSDLTAGESELLLHRFTKLKVVDKSIIEGKTIVNVQVIP